jgi:hypothetical protein
MTGFEFHPILWRIKQIKHLKMQTSEQRGKIYATLQPRRNRKKAGRKADIRNNGLFRPKTDQAMRSEAFNGRNHRKAHGVDRTVGHVWCVEL